MKLYINRLSPNSRKVIAVAQHLSLDVELETVDIAKGENKTPEYLAVNPNGMVPALVDGPTRLWESNAIMAYLASKKDTTLWPKSDARYDIFRWMSWQLAHFGPATGTFTWENMLKGMSGQGEPDAAVLEEATTKLNRFGAVLNAALEGRNFLVNDTLTIADFAVASCLTYKIPAKMPLDGFRHIAAWNERMHAVDAWLDTAPKM